LAENKSNFSHFAKKFASIKASWKISLLLGKLCRLIGIENSLPCKMTLREEQIIEASGSPIP
jgi:hypothetical protein